MSFYNSCEKRFRQSPPTHKSDIIACHYARLYSVDIWYAYYVKQYFFANVSRPRRGENSTQYPYIHKLSACFFVFYYLFTWSENRRDSLLWASHVLADLTTVVPAMETKSKGTFGYLGNSNFTPAFSYLLLFQREKERERGRQNNQCLRCFSGQDPFLHRTKH